MFIVKIHSTLFYIKFMGTLQYEICIDYIKLTVIPSMVLLLHIEIFTLLFRATQTKYM